MVYTCSGVLCSLVKKTQKTKQGTFSELVSNDFQEILAEKKESTEEGI